MNLPTPGASEKTFDCATQRGDERFGILVEEFKKRSKGATGVLSSVRSTEMLSIAARIGYFIGFTIEYTGGRRDRVRKNRRKLLSLRRLGVGGTGLEPVTSTV